FGWVGPSPRDAPALRWGPGRARRSAMRGVWCVMIVAACTAPPSASPQADITAMLARSASDWNRGDLAGFMSDYAHDSLTSYVSGSEVTHRASRIPHPGLLLMFALAGCKGSGEGVIALEGATLIDGSGRAPVTDAVILVKNGHIQAVARVNEVPVPRGALRLS